MLTPAQRVINRPACTRPGFVPTTARPLDSPDKRPLLGDAELDTFRRYGTEVAVDVGEILFCDGDEKYDLIVILDGRVEIVDQVGTPNEALVIDWAAGIPGQDEPPDRSRRILTARVSEAGPWYGRGRTGARRSSPRSPTSARSCCGRSWPATLA